MKIKDLKQEHIDEYVANTKDFWVESHKSMNAPFHPWRDSRNESLTQFMHSCSITGNKKGQVSLPSHLEHLLFEFPILKGEYLLSYAQAMILTNYRLILNDKNTGIHNIPLKDIVTYGETRAGNDIVTYNKNASKIKIEWTSISEEIFDIFSVASAILSGTDKSN